MRTIRALNSWIFGKSAVHEREVVLHRGDREVAATLTVPRGRERARPGWIVLHGMTRPGRFHPTLLRFCRSLASTGAAVLVPEVPEWKDLRLEPELTLPTVRAGLRTLRQLEATDDGPYGLIGFSFGAPQVMIASAQDDIAENVAGTVGFGGYCDIGRMVRFQMTGEFEWNGVAHRVRPDPYGRWIMAGNHLVSIPEYQDAKDVAHALRRLAMEAGERRILAWDPSYDVLKEVLRRGVTPDRRWLFDVFAPLSDRKADPKQARRLAEQLSEAAGKASPLLDPLPYLSRIRPPVHLLHGRNDYLIPYTETLRMAEAFPREKSVETTITALLAHSGDSSRLSSVRTEIREGLKLARALSRVLAIA
jgi:pimeloyl-ACP methyl ester carboxylesterase